MHIFIVGPMASGKSTIGKRLAKALDFNFIDTDKEIESKAGTDISWIFEVEGEKSFREREKKVLRESVKKDNSVISTGGGIITVEENRNLMVSRGKIVYLKASVGLQLKRTENDKKRPLLANGNKEKILKALKKARDPLYEKISNVTISQKKQKNIELILQEIIRKLFE